MTPNPEARRVRYTEVPNDFIDWWLAKCTGSEVKVMLYLFRRTRGFHKTSDHVGVRQIYRGLRGKDGTVFDRGTGLTMGTVSDALKALVEKGLVARERGSGNTADCYTPTIAQRSENQNASPPEAKTTVVKNRTLSVPESRTEGVRKTRTTKERGNKEETKRRRAHRNQPESSNSRATVEPSQSSSGRGQLPEELVAKLSQLLDLKETLGYAPDHKLLVQIATELGNAPFARFEARARRRLRGGLVPRSYGIFIELAKDTREEFTRVQEDPLDLGDS